MNWFQSLGAKLFGLDGLVFQENWGNDVFILDPASDFGGYNSDRLKVLAVFSNPAILKVFKLQCDMFSMGKVYVYNKSGKEKLNDPVVKLLNNPNYFQQKSQYLWDYMFWKMIGNAYCYIDSDNPASESNKSYWMDSYKIGFPTEMMAYKDKLILADATINLLNDIEVTYRYDDGTSAKIKWGKISHITDLTNGVGNWFKGSSTIDALFDIVANSKGAIRSKNITVRYAGKYMVAGKADPENVSQEMMGEDEKLSIEQKVNSYKNVHAVKSMIDIKRFVESGSIIGELDASYWDDYFKCGSLFGIPKDVLEASLKGATFENQEKAMGRHVDYTLSPAAELFTNQLEKRFGYVDKDIVISWDHLPFTKVFAKEKATTDKLNSEALINYMKAGVKLEEINTTLDTNFSELNYETANRTATNSGQAQTGSNENA